MKTNLIITAVLAVTVGVAAGWLAPHSSQANAAPSTTTNDTPAPTTNATVASTNQKILYYICPMHPTIHYDHAGNCPICGMKLEAVYASETNAPAATAPSCCSGGGCGQ